VIPSISLSGATTTCLQKKIGSMSLSLPSTMSDSSNNTCPYTISLLQRWRSDGSFPVIDRNDDGSFPGNISEYTRQDDVVIPRKNISLAPVFRKTGSLQRQQSHSLQSKKGRSLQSPRWKILCCSTRSRSDSNTSRDDGTNDLFADDEMPLLDWIELSGGSWSEDWSSGY
jgi:hypothetical protein